MGLKLHFGSAREVLSIYRELARVGNAPKLRFPFLLAREWCMPVERQGTPPAGEGDGSALLAACSCQYIAKVRCTANARRPRPWENSPVVFLSNFDTSSSSPCSPKTIFTVSFHGTVLVRHTKSSGINLFLPLSILCLARGMQVVRDRRLSYMRMLSPAGWTRRT